MKVRLRIGAREFATDLGQPVSLATAIDFDGASPRHFGAPAPEAQPLALPGFSGSVATGASCNCSTITLTPHCNGTHTECVGHLTHERLDAHRIVPSGLIPAAVVSAPPAPAAASGETSDPPPRAGDLLVTRARLERAWPAQAPFAPRALVIRTGGSAASVPPYLSSEAGELLVERGIEHLVVDLPSVDRVQDEGRLRVHRIFFGLPPDSGELGRAARSHCTITELASVPQSVADGAWLLELQVPALGGDAVPSRPLLYPVEPT